MSFARWRHRVWVPIKGITQHNTPTQYTYSHLLLWSLTSRQLPWIQVLLLHEVAITPANKREPLKTRQVSHAWLTNTRTIQCQPYITTLSTFSTGHSLENTRKDIKAQKAVALNCAYIILIKQSVNNNPHRLYFKAV